MTKNTQTTLTITEAEANQIAAYNPEIQTKLRELADKKAIIADFKKNDEKAQELAEIIKAAQEDLKNYVETHDDNLELVEEIGALEGEIKEAIKAAANKTSLKVKDLGKYFKARAKKKVKEVIEVGEVFNVLDDKIGGASDDIASFAPSKKGGV